MTKKGEEDLTSFSDLNLTMYARTELWGQRMEDGETSLPDRVEAPLVFTMDMATVATDENRQAGTEALHRVQTQSQRQL